MLTLNGAASAGAIRNARTAKIPLTSLALFCSSIKEGVPGAFGALWLPGKVVRHTRGTARRVSAQGLVSPCQLGTSGVKTRLAALALRVIARSPHRPDDLA